MRLGEYLMVKGKLSKREIDAACQMQRVNNHMIGVLAVDRGFLTCEQLEEVIYRQTNLDSGSLFGELAVSIGYLTQQQVDSLLDVQVQNHLRLGDVLILQSRITEAELLEELREFRDYCQREDRRPA